MHALDELAEAIRGRLIDAARADSTRAAALADGLEAEVRALVEREAGVLDPADRAALCERVLRLGRIERADVRFAGETELMHAIERILAPLGRRVDEASPLCDARLPDGS